MEGLVSVDKKDIRVGGRRCGVSVDLGGKSMHHKSCL